MRRVKEVVELQQDLSNGFLDGITTFPKINHMKCNYGNILSLEAVVEEPTQEQIDIIQDRLTLHLLVRSFSLDFHDLTDTQSDIEVQNIVLYIFKIILLFEKDFTTILQGFGLVE